MENNWRRSRDEQETNINWFYGDKTIKLWTCDSTVISALKRRGWEPKRAHHDGVFFELPKKALTFRDRRAMEAAIERGREQSKRQAGKGNPFLKRTGNHTDKR